MKHITGNKLLALITSVLIISSSVGVAVAYFSDYTQGAGSAKLSLNGETTVTEEVDEASGEKTIVVENTGDANMVARVAIYGPDGMEVTPGDNWEKIGNWYYYKKVLTKSEPKTTEIKAAITNIPVTEDMGSFDIVVIHESAIAVVENNTVVKPDNWETIPNITF